MGAHGDSFAAMDTQITLKNPNLGLFVVGTDSHMQRDTAAELFPFVQSAQMGNKEISPKTGNLSNFSKKSNLGSSLGVAVDEFNSGNHGLGNLNPGLIGLDNANPLSLVNDGSDHVAPSQQPFPSSIVGRKQ
ncbi:hypothetical protein TorRG33x02_343850 [Trema orientale]|uniref:Uncharacterized protein n=1 Tax=Trema orientale TaxID=63057 RepID=A0A2P5AR13_TREOI|nr:hypothetical protein TorRG33x02_343850 [Trema orientale]